LYKLCHISCEKTTHTEIVETGTRIWRCLCFIDSTCVRILRLFRMKIG
jgi:hypothetical protein